MTLKSRSPLPGRFSRRDFLKLGGAAALSLAFQRLPEKPAGRLGRVTSTVKLRNQPSAAGQEIGFKRADDLVNIYETVVGDPEPAHNPRWFRVDDGWVHSSFVQPVRSEPNTPVLEVPPEGFLAEVTVPFTEAWRNQRLAYRFYYSSTHWVDRVEVDEAGNVWYRVMDDRYQVPYFVPAAHLRRVPDEELTPLAPDVTDKRIEVDLGQQRLTAYANGTAVYTARIASGRAGSVTPTGEFRVARKRPSRHMAAAGPNGFDLPGVAWVAYFNWTGVAFHGTYWHNDYGRPRSRGCVNLTPEAAKWVYRWTLPVVPPGQPYLREANGTHVVVY